jgi:hypothetical protein
MIDLGEFDARATVLASAEEQASVFARHRARVQALMLDKRPEWAYNRDLVKQKERTMKALEDYVEGRNRIRALFKQRPLSLDRARDRQQLADDIDMSLSPENLTCDGELSRSMVERKYRMLTKVAGQLKKLDPNVTFMELA